MLKWPYKIMDQLKTWSEKCYPYEGCGLVLGQTGQANKAVQQFAPLSNLLRERQKAKDHTLNTAADTLGKRVDSQGQFEFIIDPAEFNRVALEGEKKGLDVIGILHTHPDHPAVPSATDAAQPLLSGWSNIIVKVDKGSFVEARSWVRENEQDPFQEEKIDVIQGDK
jgi:proteasome lid subunit RPN8/RPN11